jgi:CRISPR-associated protein (TIGR02710 family)
MSTPAEKVLLIVTVGGAHEPVVTSLVHWRPARARFVASHQTGSRVPEIVAQAQAHGVTLDPGAYDTTIVRDPEQLVACVEAMRRLDQEVRSWLGRGEEYRIVVDYTGGTKTMSAALALVAHRWKCGFSYVGGTIRTKEGVGLVQSGTERVVATSNPWDELGYRGIEDACEAFDLGNYGPAADVANEWLRAVTDPRHKRTFATLKSLIEGYAAWDRFDHAAACTRLADVRKNGNDLYALFGAATSDRLLEILRQHEIELGQLKSAHGASEAMVRDLIANARRRAEEGRFDDAVARLYRAIEAAAQVRLAAEHGISDTGCVPVEALPESLRARWSDRAEGGTVTLGLQDAYRLLAALGDQLGQRFVELQLDLKTSPLATRNQSVLAHGFRAVGQQAFEQLWGKVLELCDIRENVLPVFPKLGRNEP